MNSIRTLIVDDSAVYRSEIRAALEVVPGVKVVGALHHGKLALEHLVSDRVDLVILDMEMPEMNGLETLRAIQRTKWNGKVLMFAASSSRSAEATIEALRLGAQDFVLKPGPEADKGLSASEKIRAVLEPKIKSLFCARPRAKAPSSRLFTPVIWDLFTPQVVLIGASTGGPAVLERIFAQLAPPFGCPVLLVQHMPPVFTASFAQRLSKLCGAPAREALQGEELKEGVIYVAPGDYHMSVKKSQQGAVSIHLDQNPKIHSVRPAVDPLFQSAAQVYKDKCLGFVLTGMGVDGKDGAVALKKAGSAVVIQSEDTCTVFGMPGAVQQVGAYDKTASPEEIAEILKEKLMLSSASRGVRCG